MEEAIKIVGIIASLIAIYKIAVELMLARSTRRRDEYSFTKQFISDISDSSDQHPYILEKGFLALTGKIYSVDELRILLRQKSPSVAISQRSSATGFVVFDEASRQYSWKGKYGRPFIRKHAGKWFFACYMVTAILALLPVYLIGLELLASIPTVAYSVSLLVVAISCLSQQSDLETAISFMSSIEYEHA
ncbi:MAG TPA: hypothetical protein DIW43_10105 [Spongiibacteraceae bacterium]|nr:hypothetical protein [Spongiibacteraceae bacterium]HCS27798.1 hypothetical protein [Spongiibacteraceae bacterium]|tara:strand:+ start:53 stop:622 length:570 start_codon:yes stop_codon:yes gene_type:complete